MRTTATAIVTTDRIGNKAYVWADGVSVVKDGAGRMCWSLYRAEDNAYGAPGYFTTTLFDAIANV